MIIEKFSPKSTFFGLPCTFLLSIFSKEAKISTERVITIGADSNSVLMDALQRVLEKVASDPLHAQQTETSTKSSDVREN